MRKVILSILTTLILFNGCEKIVFKDPLGNPLVTDKTPPTVMLTDPVNAATGIALNKSINITFSEAMDPLTITSSTITLAQGATPVATTVSYTGTVARLTLTGNLTPNKVYTANVTTGAKDVAGNALAANYTFNFTTSAAPDITPPVVSASDPANSSTAVALSKIVTVTFSEAMDPLTITGSTFTLKQGSISVSGTVNYTGTQASFVSSGNLLPGTVYTGIITTGAKDVAGNALASNYTFSFTTGTAPDLTPPTVLSTSPVSNAIGVATSQVVGITFSEAMLASSITTTSFTLKQGATAVAGTVSYSGNTASFTPSAALTAGTVYTASLSTGAKDVAGNTMASAMTWTFTTAGTAGLSFANDVIPVLNICENCHNHGWTPSSNASTYYNNLVNRGYVKPTSYTTSTIYTKIQNGHPGTGYISKANNDKIINWMIQGSLNN